MGDVVESLRVTGALEEKDVRWEKAKNYLKSEEKEGRVRFHGKSNALTTKEGSLEEQKPSSYSARFKQGATLVPRNFYFVNVKDLGKRVNSEKLYWAETDPEQAKESKAPYKEIRMSGHIEGKFIFSTALAKHVLPFVVLNTPKVVLPIEIKSGFFNIMTSGELRNVGFREIANWMVKCEKLWIEKREDKAVNQTVYERIDYQKGISAQSPNHRHLILYNAAGKNISASYFDRETAPMPFVVESKLYWASFSSLEEADYLCAILNSEFINEAMKPFQSAGLLGERDIHKKALGLPIPEFDLKVK